ncbi:hypothetical protein ACF0HT_13805 (plasmid) [Staphylococcus xylosus]|uniref:hypothetical protein n=1 Tax=Staphylococcus xylosus TaxID=1288 RepID=UPI00374A8961
MKFENKIEKNRMCENANRNKNKTKMCANANSRTSPMGYGMTWDNVDEDTRLFKDINDYVSCVYDTDDVISNFFEFMTYLATEETESVYTE